MGKYINIIEFLNNKIDKLSSRVSNINKTKLIRIVTIGSLVLFAISYNSNNSLVLLDNEIEVGVFVK